MQLKETFPSVTGQRSAFIDKQHNMTNDAMQAINTNGCLAMPHNFYKFLDLDKLGLSPSFSSPNSIFSSMATIV